MENTIKKNKIAIIGLGYVGLPLALLAERKGYEVIGIVRNPEKAAKINKKIVPFHDKELEKQLSESKLLVSTDYTSIKDAAIVIICVPTPVHLDYTPDLEPVISATEGVAKNLKQGQLVILESTVNPGVCDDVVLPILEEQSGLVAGQGFYLAHCPERINPGDTKWNVENINRVVGGFDEVSVNKAKTFYESIITGNVKQMNSLKEAEAVKVVENAFRDINIAFVNELAMSFSHLNIDVVNVIQGAATKPFSFMPHFPGAGVGGHCIPVDPYYLIEYAKKNGFYHEFLSLARRINNKMPHFTIEQLERGLNEYKLAINGTRIAVLGVAYKGNIDDDRESPSYEIIKLLKERGADVVIYDPYVLRKSTVKTLDEALIDTKAIIIATAHSSFKDITPEILKAQGVHVVVDGRNCLNKEAFIEAGLIYRGIGR
jgi:nucleotide sugar dehydrogenase